MPLKSLLWDPSPKLNSQLKNAMQISSVMAEASTMQVSRIMARGGKCQPKNRLKGGGGASLYGTRYGE